MSRVQTWVSREGWHRDWKRENQRQHDEESYRGHTYGLADDDVRFSLEIVEIETRNGIWPVSRRRQSQFTLYQMDHMRCSVLSILNIYIRIPQTS